MDALPYLFSGISVGAIYALVALGFVLVYKATTVVNFAHGSFLMLAAYLAVTLLVRVDLPFLAGLAIIVVAMALLGIAIHYSIMRWMIGKAFFSVVLVTVGLEIVIRAVLLITYGPLEFGRITKLPQGSLDFAGVGVPIVNLIILGSATLTVVLFLLFFRYSRMGLHMRAVAENLEAAAAMGISPNRIYATAWAVGLLLAGIAGVLYGHYTPSIDLNLSVIGLRAFPAAILGGIDSVQGAIIGGLVVGIVETMGAGYLGSEWRDVIAFGIMFAVLLWRPTGLFGTRELIRV